MAFKRGKKKHFKWYIWCPAPWQSPIRELVGWILYFYFPLHERNSLTMSSKLVCYGYPESVDKDSICLREGIGLFSQVTWTPVQTTCMATTGSGNLPLSNYTGICILENTEVTYWCSDGSAFLSLFKILEHWIWRNVKSFANKMNR